jgi:Holliday junction resolvase RusA-like endonuclease
MKFTIQGEPVAKGRPRFGKNKYTGAHMTFTPEKTANYENWVRTCYIEQCNVMMDGLLQMSIKAYFSIPKSGSKKTHAMMENGELRPTKRPDIDNIIKGVADALNKIAYHDDSQIVRIKAEKFYSYNPRVEVEVDQF